MFNVNDYVVYKRDVCKIVDYKENAFKNKDYYVLTPVYDNSLRIDVPVDCDKLRSIISIEDLNKIINSIPDIAVLNLNDRLIEQEYHKLLYDGTYEGLISIIKTTYLRNNDRLNKKRKISEKDDTYFKLAEKYLYGEFSVVLGLSFDETKNYVIKRVEDVIKKCN